MNKLHWTHLIGRADPNSCKSHKVRNLIQEFLADRNWKARGGARHGFRIFAHFLSYPKSQWPAAIEKLLSLPSNKALSTIVDFKRRRRTERLERRQPHRGSPPGIDKFLTFARKHGYFPWASPGANMGLSQAAWQQCPTEMRNKIEEWTLTQRNRNLTPLTIRNKRSALRNFGVFIRSKHVHFLKVDYPVARKWVEDLRLKNFSTSYINSHILAIRCFYRFLRMRRYIKEDEVKDLSPMRRSTHLPKMLSVKEMRRLINKASEIRLRAMLEVLYSTGCRVGELASMKISDVSLEERTVKVFGKGKQERILFLNRSSVRALKAYYKVRNKVITVNNRPTEATLFLGIKGRKLIRSSICQLVKDHAKSVGLGNRIRTHVIRHSCATHMLENGADLFSLMRLLGHKNLNSTACYLHTAISGVAEVHRKCHPRK